MDIWVVVGDKQSPARKQTQRPPSAKGWAPSAVRILLIARCSSHGTTIVWCNNPGVGGSTNLYICVQHAVLDTPQHREHVLHASRLTRDLPGPLLSIFQPSLRSRRLRVQSLDRQPQDPFWRQAAILLHFRFRVPRRAYVPICRPGGVQDLLRLFEHHFRLGRL